MLVSDVGVNFLIIPPGIFFLSSSKRYVVSDIPHSGISPCIFLSHVDRNIDWSDPTLPAQYNLICPERISCSASFTASAGFQPGSAATQNKATNAKLKTRKIFITRYKISLRRGKASFFSARCLVDSDYYLPSSVAFFQVPN